MTEAAAGSRHPQELSLLAGTGVVLVLSALATAAMAWPVLLSLDTMILGREIAGRHHDPFTVMQQFAGSGAYGPYQQPLTDQLGVGLARLFGAIPAYNIVMLLSFPLTAVSTYLLGRYLWRSHAAALVAALAFAFAPAHVAHAIYQVHVAQTEWLPLYFLALFAAIDRPSVARMILLLASAAALVMSNDYAGLIGAIATPVALPAYWLARRPSTRWQALVVPSASLALAAVAGVLAIRWAFPELTSHPEQFAFPREDLARYGGRWWAYFLPPVYHPVFGQAVVEVIRQAGLVPGTVELQLSLSWALTALAVLALVSTLRQSTMAPTERTVLAVGAIALWALLASLAPPDATCSPDSLQPACLGHRVAPMFRAYARIGIVTSLCVALLAGYAAAMTMSWGRSRRRPVAKWAIGTALVVAAFELWPLPGARDVMPTEAHRALADRPESLRVLDCVEWTTAEAALPWLMRKEIRFLQNPFEGCDEPDLAPKLAALGFSHLIVRTSLPSPWPESAAPDGFTLEGPLRDARLYTVAALPAPVVIIDVGGFSGWEGTAIDRWRWMGQRGGWTILNTTREPVRAGLRLELQSFAEPRHLDVEVDGALVATLAVAVTRTGYLVGPLALGPGIHAIRFLARELAARPVDLVEATKDRRPLTVSFHGWRWEAGGP